MATFEQKLADAMRVKLDLPRSTDLAPYIGPVMRSLGNKESREAIMNVLASAQLALGVQVDGHACGELADLLLEKFPDG